MSSIAYLTDPKMIEFTRSSGNRELNFWRLSTRNFEHFSPGSLLFFVDSRYQDEETREKGIIGYGRALKIRKMSPKKMWKEYTTRNGYPDSESFYDAIKSRAKSGELPEAMQCIELEEVMFFKGPIFLHEFGEAMPTHLESFVYLDKGEDFVTKQILTLAKEVGIDMWYQNLNLALNNSTLDRHLTEQDLRKILSEISHPSSKPQQKLLGTYKTLGIINGIGYTYEGDKPVVVFPCTSIKIQQYPILGMIHKIKNDTPMYDVSFRVLIKKGSNDSNQFLNLGIALEYI